jgi:hypothetical protein
LRSPRHRISAREGTRVSQDVKERLRPVESSGEIAHIPGGEHVDIMDGLDACGVVIKHDHALARVANGTSDLGGERADVRFGRQRSPLSCTAERHGLHQQI